RPRFSARLSRTRTRSCARRLWPARRRRARDGTGQRAGSRDTRRAGLHARREGPVAETHPQRRHVSGTRNRRHFGAQGRGRLRARHRHLPAAVLHLRGRMGRQRNRRRHARQGAHEPRSRGRALRPLRKPDNEGDDPPRRQGSQRLCAEEGHRRADRRDRARDAVGRIDKAAQRLDVDPAGDAARNEATDHSQREEAGRGRMSAGTAELAAERAAPADPARRLAAMRDLLLKDALVPYPGPGLLALSGSALPATPEAVAAALNAKAPAPARIRANMWSVAQFIESRRHRKTLQAFMTDIFAAAVSPSALVRFLAGAPLSLVVNSWYDDEFATALRQGARDDSRSRASRAPESTPTSGRSPTTPPASPATGLRSRRRARCSIRPMAAFGRRATFWWRIRTMSRSCRKSTS